MAYSEFRKKIDRLYDTFHPEYSERLFIKLMGQLWFWRYTFEHQGRVGPYRPDFVSHRYNLIIEIDGRVKIPRDILKQQDYFDQQRTRDMYLYRKGYNVLHMSFTDIRDKPEAARRLVKRWVRDPAEYRRRALLEQGNQNGS